MLIAIVLGMLIRNLLSLSDGARPGTILSQKNRRSPSF